MQEKRLLIRGTILATIILATAWSQSFTAATRGTVTDASGSSVPGTKVVVTKADRTRRQRTPPDAISCRRYKPGQYNLTVEAAGFKKFAQRSFQLQVQQQATLNVKLEVGEQTFGSPAEYNHRQPRAGDR